jgi:hypothetical protein
MIYVSFQEEFATYLDPIWLNELVSIIFHALKVEFGKEKSFKISQSQYNIIL